MTGMSFYHNYMDLPVAGILHTGVPHYYWGAEAGESEEQFSARRARELEELIIREGPDTIGGFIGEPVLGTGGIIPPPKGYWAEIQAILRKYDVLFIADEVICGFGRLGVPFGCNLYDIEPDMVTVAKGLTSGYAPLSAAIISEHVFEVMSQGSETIGAFSHGYTYSGHTLCTAAANAVLDILERENITSNAATVGKYFQERMREAFGDNPIVGEVRGVGMLAAIECVADRTQKRRFASSQKVGAKLSAAALKHGLIARAMPQGDILGFAPPLVATKDDIDQIVESAELAVRDVADELSRATKAV
jgi:L-2,4-diaminobutyrate transaminase